MKALIIGAGIGGLTAGIALRQAGADVSVFERRSDLADIQIGGGIVLWANAVRALQQLGLAEPVQHVGLTVHKAENRTSSGQMLFEIPVEEFERRLGAPTVTVSRANLHPVLESALGAGVVQLNRECTGFEQNSGGVTAHFADGKEEHGDLLISADGRNSRLRLQLGHAGESFPPYAGYTLYSGVARFDRDPVPQGLFRIMTGRGMQLYFFHIEPSTVYWSVGVYGPAGTRGREYDAAYKPLLQRLLKGWAEPVEALVEATDASELARRDMHGGQPLEQWGNDRVTLLGDAAHPMTVTPGQGACTAIEDAMVLARCLKEHTEPVAALRQYEILRQERTANWMRVSHSLESRVNVTNPARVWIRNQIMGIALGRLGLINRSAYFKEMVRPV